MKRKHSPPTDADVQNELDAIEAKIVPLIGQLDDDIHEQWVRDAISEFEPQPESE